MRTIHGAGGLAPERFHRPVATIGVFDGVHRGHRVVLAKTREMAARIGGEVVVLTFHQHPRAVTQGRAPPLVTSLPHRLHLLAREGVDTTIVLHFDEELRSMEAERFVEDVLVRGIGVRGVVAGHDTHFGHNRRGDVEMLRRTLTPRGVPVESTDPVRLGDGTVVSSSAIRDAVARGDLALSERLLGRAPALYGTVVRGDGRGRTIGFPTANLDLDGELAPNRGVYGAAVEIDGRTWPAVVNVGGRPTFHVGGPDVVEVHVIGWSDDLYGRVLDVFVLGRIRDERRFESVDALRTQIAADVATLRERLAAGVWRLDRPGWAQP